MSDNGQAPLIERLRRVPAIARVMWQTPCPGGYEIVGIPVGALCQEAADRIAELEADLERMTAARNRDHQQALANGAAAAAERERRKAAEALLADAVNGALAFSSHGVVKGILNHFARHEKD